MLLHAGDGLGIHRVHVHHGVFLLGGQDAARLAHGHLAQLGLLGQHAAQHVVHTDVHARDFAARRDLFHLDLDDRFLELAGAKLLAHVRAAAGQLLLLLFARLGLLGLVAQNHVDGVDLLLRHGAGDHFHQTVFHRLRGEIVHLLGLLLFDDADTGFGEVADDGFHIAAHIADLGELGGFHLDERRVHQLGQTARDFGFANARGADHEDVFGRDLFADLLGQLHAAVAVAKRHGHGALGLILTHDIAIQFLDDFSGRPCIHAQTTSTMMWSFVYTQMEEAIFSAL